MSKIEILSVEVTGKAQVINLSPYFVCRVVKAQMAAKNALKDAKQPIYEEDENGNKVQVTDESGNKQFRYDRYRVDEDDVKILCEDVLPLLQEFVDALEGKE